MVDSAVAVVTEVTVDVVGAVEADVEAERTRRRNGASIVSRRRVPHLKRTGMLIVSPLNAMTI